MAKKRQVRISEVLRAHLKRVGMTVSELSRATEGAVRISTIATWLEGGSVPKDAASVALVAEVLGTTMHQLYFGEPERDASLDDMGTELVLDGYYRLRLERVVPSRRKLRE